MSTEEEKSLTQDQHAHEVQLDPINPASDRSGKPARSQRLDSYLSTRFPGVSRRQWQEHIRRGQVRVEGNTAAKGSLVRSGMTITFSGLSADLPGTGPRPEAPQGQGQGQGQKPEQEPEAGTSLPLLTSQPPAAPPPLHIVHEDPWLIAVRKPGGMPCHPLTGTADSPQAGDTLIGRLIAMHGECALKELREGGADSRRILLQGGLLHRLDNGTSGIVLAARSAEAWHAFRSLVQGSRNPAMTEKYYLALCQKKSGTPLPDSIDYPIAHGRHRGSGKMQAVINNRGAGQEGDRKAQAYRGQPRRALSRILGSRPAAAAGGLWVLVQIHRGQRHQIRCHLGAAGLPLMGDRLYGSTMQFPGAGEFLLHHRRICLEHVFRRQRICIDDPLDTADIDVPGEDVHALEQWIRTVLP